MTEPIIMTDGPTIIRRDRFGKVLEITFKADRFYRNADDNDFDYSSQEPKHVCMDEDRAYRQIYGDE